MNDTQLRLLARFLTVTQSPLSIIRNPEITGPWRAMRSEFNLQGWHTEEEALQQLRIVSSSFQIRRITGTGEIYELTDEQREYVERRMKEELNKMIHEMEKIWASTFTSDSRSVPGPTST